MSNTAAGGAAAGNAAAVNAAANAAAGNAAAERLTAYRRTVDALRREVRADRWYPRYHLAAPFGSAGDTHPIYAGGRYHVTYQHSYSPDFRAMHGPCQWGHAASADLVTWTHYPPALTSAEHGVAADRHLWSGGLIAHRGRVFAFYTIENRDVYLAVSDGEDLQDFRAHHANPVATLPPDHEALGIPYDPQRADEHLMGMRDPWVWRDGDRFRMVVGSGRRDKIGGLALLYESSDLYAWRYRGVLWAATDPERDGIYFECPCVQPLGGGRYLLSNINHRQYAIGEIRDGRFVEEQRGFADHGHNFLVSVLTRDDAGRLFMWGWVPDKNRRTMDPDIRWAGVFTVPREFTRNRSGGFDVAPAPEIAALRRNHRRWADRTYLTGSVEELGQLGASVEIGLAVDTGDPADPEYHDVSCGLRITGDSFCCEVTWSAADRQLRLLTPDNEYAAPLPLAGGAELRMRVFVDASVLEVFADGAAPIANRIYPPNPDRLAYRFFVRGAPLDSKHAVSLRRLDVWDLDSIDSGHDHFTDRITPTAAYVRRGA